MAAGVALASGWPEKGSTRACTSAPTRPSDEVSWLQWIGANSEPGRCPSADDDLEHGAAERCFDAREIACGEAEPRGIVRMQLHIRDRAVRSEARAAPGARHRVPLVARPAGIQEIREALRHRLGERRPLGNDEARPPVGRVEAAFARRSGRGRRYRPRSAATAPAQGCRSPRRKAPRGRRCRNRGCRRSRTRRAPRARRRSRPGRNTGRHRRTPCAAPPR